MSSVFSDAIIRYFDYGNASFPQANLVNSDPLVTHKLGLILKFADELQPNWNEHNLESAGNWAKAEIADEFPYLTQEAVNALAWACTYGWK